AILSGISIPNVSSVRITISTPSNPITPSSAAQLSWSALSGRQFLAHAVSIAPNYRHDVVVPQTRPRSSLTVTDSGPFGLESVTGKYPRELVDQTSASWNHVRLWLHRLAGLVAGQIFLVTR